MVSSHTTPRSRSCTLPTCPAAASTAVSLQRPVKTCLTDHCYPRLPEISQAAALQPDHVPGMISPSFDTAASYAGCHQAPQYPPCSDTRLHVVYFVKDDPHHFSQQLRPPAHSAASMKAGMQARLHRPSALQSECKTLVAICIQNVSRWLRGNRQSHGPNVPIDRGLAALKQELTSDGRDESTRAVCSAHPVHTPLPGLVTWLNAAGGTTSTPEQ